jgi:hypothetical protein
MAKKKVVLVQAVNKQAKNNANKNKNKNKKKKANKARKRQMASTRGAMFGPVTSINTAPVAIGNSIRGAAASVVRSKNGVIVRGRDMAFTPIGTGSVTTWTLVGGIPLTPAAFVDSNLRNYMQMYQKFRWTKFVAHYITSSATSSTGDIMFYYGKNRNSVFLNQTSNNLLQFVLTDEDTVIGPQWTNHSMAASLKSCWLSTDYGMSSVVDDFSEGELFLLSKTSTSDSPGYVILDYEVEFAEQQLAPRLLALPISRIIWNQLSIAQTSATTTQGSTALKPALSGNNLTGNASVMPTGATIGDIYKMIIDVTNSAAGSWTNVTTANLLTWGTDFVSNPVNTVSDGMTLYAVISATNTFVLFPNAESAYTYASTYATYNVTNGSSSTYNLQVWISFLGNIASTLNLTPNF